MIFFVTLNNNKPINQPEINPKNTPAIIAILVSHQFLTVLINQKNSTETVVQPTIDIDKKKVLKPELIDFCCKPTNKDAEIIPALISPIKTAMNNSPKTIPITAIIRKTNKPITNKLAMKLSSFLKESFKYKPVVIKLVNK